MDYTLNAFVYFILKQKSIDNIAFRNYKVEMIFCDPTVSMVYNYPDNVMEENANRNNFLKNWDNNLYETAVYLFILRNKHNNICRYYCVRGLKGVKNRFILEIIKADGLDDFNPNITDYTNKTIAVKKLGIYGSLFEDMEFIKKDKAILTAGQSTVIYDRKMRIILHKEIIDAVRPIIQKDIKNFK